MSASSHHNFNVSEMLSLQCKSFKDQGNAYRCTGEQFDQWRITNVDMHTVCHTNKPQ